MKPEVYSLVLNSVIGSTTTAFNRPQPNDILFEINDSALFGMKPQQLYKIKIDAFTLEAGTAQSFNQSLQYYFEIDTGTNVNMIFNGNNSNKMIVVCEPYQLAFTSEIPNGGNYKCYAEYTGFAPSDRIIVKVKQTSTLGDNDTFLALNFPQYQMTITYEAIYEQSNLEDKRPQSFSILWNSLLYGKEINTPQYALFGKNDKQLYNIDVAAYFPPTLFGNDNPLHLLEIDTGTKINSNNGKIVVPYEIYPKASENQPLLTTTLPYSGKGMFTGYYPNNVITLRTINTTTGLAITNPPNFILKLTYTPIYNNNCFANYNSVLYRKETPITLVLRDGDGTQIAGTYPQNRLYNINAFALLGRDRGQKYKVKYRIDYSDTAIQYTNQGAGLEITFRGSNGVNTQQPVGFRNQQTIVALLDRYISRGLANNLPGAQLYSNGIFTCSYPSNEIRISLYNLFNANKAGFVTAGTIAPLRIIFEFTEIYDDTKLKNI